MHMLDRVTEHQHARPAGQGRRENAAFRAYAPICGLLMSSARGGYAADVSMMTRSRPPSRCASASRVWRSGMLEDSRE